MLFYREGALCRIFVMSTLQHVGKKNFHVSPFWDVTGNYRFTIRPPGNGLNLVIDSIADGDRIHMANIKAKQVPATSGTLLKIAIMRPLATMAVTFGIHWQALRLWIKGAGYRSKPIAPEMRTTIAHKILQDKVEDKAA